MRVLPGAGPFAQSAVDAVRSTGALQAGDDVRIMSADELGPGHGPVLVERLDDVEAPSDGLDEVGVWVTAGHRHSCSCCVSGWRVPGPDALSRASRTFQ